ncbi:uncharacterized protein BDV14DRAFT_20139 [Aspergillus stella-maris]|uniref:uncharacterized protein n=1 Tax=Aspergillus stella-maris TaxID=1810926 RepID=UPI003CCDD712
MQGTGRIPRYLPPRSAGLEASRSQPPQTARVFRPSIVPQGRTLALTSSSSVTPEVSFLIVLS